MMDRKALKQLYEKTRFQVWPDGTTAAGHALHVGEASPRFDALLRERGIRSWAIITAYNPGDERPGDAANQRAQENLLDDLNDYQRWDAAGSDPDSPHREPSVFVWNMPAGAARSIGARYRQACVLCGEPGTPPWLEWC